LGWQRVLRAFGFVLALALGLFSIWLIVTSDSSKWIRVGVLAGFWGLLIGAFSIFGRHLRQPAGSVDTAELELRVRAALDRPDDTQARLDFEIRLIQALRQEMHQTVADEVAKIAADVAAVRTELIEKLGGQLRMERIETTRIFGSDIEALHAEIDQLKRGQPRVIDVPSPVEPVVSLVALEPRVPLTAAGPVISVTRDPRPVVTASLAPAPPRPPDRRIDALADISRLSRLADLQVGSMPRSTSSLAELGLEPPRPGPSSAAMPAAAEQSAPEKTSTRTGGRRRRESGDGNNVLAQIIARAEADR
jgi:hypothetical protein